VRTLDEALGVVGRMCVDLGRFVCEELRSRFHERAMEVNMMWKNLGAEVCTCIYVWMCVYVPGVYVCVDVRVGGEVCAYIYMCVCGCLWVCMHAYIRVEVCVCLCVCMYMCVYIYDVTWHIHTQTERSHTEHH